MAKTPNRFAFGLPNTEAQKGISVVHVELDAAGNPVDWTYLYVDEGLARLENKTVEELEGHRFFELFPDRDRKRMLPHFEAAYHGKAVFFDDISEELGQYIHVDVFPMPGEGNCICVLSDVRENIIREHQREAEREELLSAYEEERATNQKIRQCAYALGITYPLVISADYTEDTYQIIEYENFLNKTAEESGNIDDLIRVGASTVPDEKIANEFWTLFNRKAVIEAFKSGKTSLSLRHPQMGDDGKVHYMSTHVICTEMSEERVCGISMSKCIDEEAERDIAYREIADQAEVIHALSDLYSTIVVDDLRTHRYRIIKTADALYSITNGQKEGDLLQIEEALLTYFIHPDFREKMREFMDTRTMQARMEKTDTLLMEFKSPLGRYFESRFIVQQRDEAGCAQKVLFTAREITKEKEHEFQLIEQLRSSAIEAEKANTSKTNFLRRMSHDIRTPLNGIIGMLRIMDSTKGDKERFEECMDKIQRSADYLLTIVNNVLDVSKMESGTIELEHKPFDLGRLLLNMLPIVSTNATQNSVLFLGGEADSHIRHRYVVGSPVHLNRVLMNVASNAIKYNRPGGSLRLYCNELKSDGIAATYEFVCEDTGLGMSEEFLKHAFEPFTREGKPTTTSFSGSGLGLSIVREIINKMGGTVELTSEENVGTTVRIVLSLTLNEDGKRLYEEKDRPLEKLNLSGHRALLVEDNEINTEIASILLEEIGLRVTSAENGQVALDVFTRSDPYTFDFIFMDMMMPVMDGIEATRAIRTLNRPDATSVPIIAMTANAFLEDRKTCLEAGMNDHIGKPIDPEEVSRVLRGFVK